MNNNIVIPKKVKVIAVIFLIIFIGLGIINMFEYYSFHLVNLSPASNDISNISPFIDFNFNYELKNKGILVTSTPKIVSSYKVYGKTLRVYFNSLLSTKKQYLIVLNHIYNTNKSELKNIKINFRPIYSPQSLTKAQSEYVLKAQAQGEALNAMAGLESILPFVSPNGDFEVSYSNIANNFKLIITAQGSANQQEAINWLSNNGYSVQGLNVQYINSAPI